MVRVPVSTAQRRSLSLDGIRRLLHSIIDPRTYGRIVYLLLALPLGVVEFTLLVTAISFGFGTAITLIGIPVLIGTVWAWRWLAELERGLFARLVGVEIPSPYRPDPVGARWWRRVAARLADPATWKDLAFLLLQFPLGIVSFTVATTVLGVGFAALFAPAYFWALPDDSWFADIDLDMVWGAIALVPLGAIVLLLGIPGLNALGRLYGWLATQLLGSSADPVLTAQVTELQDARSRIIAAADDERRRIERDLHDGAQQRLVALALNLRMAEQRAVDGDPTTVELIQAAGEEANLALKELRDLARGIHPAILTNRGLPAALQDLATRATVPTEVVAAPDERLPGSVEAAAYFVVSECLANIAKHAEAEAATVAVSVEDGRLTVEVSDDGVGGAELDGGSGMQGLADRVGALSGSLAVTSPPGVGTRVTAVIPLSAEAAEAPVGEPALSPEQRAALRERHRHALRYRLLALGLVAGVLTAIWALTDPDLPWIVWPLLPLGLIAALDAWHFHTSGNRLLHYGGALALFTLFTIGIWLASGADYFWPAWVMLATVVAVALTALPRPRDSA